MTTAGESAATDLLRAELVSARQELDQLRRDLAIARTARIATTKDLGRQIAEMTRQRDQALMSAESAWKDYAVLTRERDDALAERSKVQGEKDELARDNHQLREQLYDLTLRVAAEANQRAQFST